MAVPPATSRPSSGSTVEFHDLLRHLSGNRLIVQFVGMLLGVDSAVRRQALSEPAELRRGINEHRRVFQAVVAGDQDDAERLMREHVLRTAQHTLGVNLGAARERVVVMSRRVRLAELTRVEVQRRAPQAVAVVPVGACEQHGPHLPLGTDTFIVEHVALAAASRLNGDPDVVVAPAVSVGFSPHHVPIGATLTVEPQTLNDVVAQMCGGLVAAGFRRLFLLNGHGGNAELLVVTARTVGQEHRVLTAAGSYWVMAWDELVDADAQRDGRLPGHAGAFETSIMAALRPDLVAEPPEQSAGFTANPRGYFGPYHVEDAETWLRGSGFSDNPAAVERRRGRALCGTYCRPGLRGVARVRGQIAGSTPHRPRSGPEMTILGLLRPRGCPYGGG